MAKKQYILNILIFISLLAICSSCQAESPDTESLKYRFVAKINLLMAKAKTTYTHVTSEIDMTRASFLANEVYYAWEETRTGICKSFDEPKRLIIISTTTLASAFCLDRCLNRCKRKSANTV